MEKFFVHPSLMESSAGYDLFSLTHFIYLLVCTLVIVFFSVWYVKSDQKRRQSIRWLVASIVLLSQVIRVSASNITIGFHLSELPLHLCGMSVFLVSYHAWRPNARLSDAIYMLSLPGAIVSLLFLDWSHQYQWNIFTLQSWIVHLMMAVYVIMLLAGHDLHPQRKNILAVATIFALYASGIYVFNKLWNTNFLFLNYPAPGFPMETFSSWLGNPGYILILLGILLSLWTILYGFRKTS